MRIFQFKNSSAAHVTTLAIEALVAVLAAAFLAAYAFIAVERAAYPFDLEWMEGSLVQHVARVTERLPLYTQPTVTFVPFLYPPLYYYVSAAVALVTGVGFLPLRVVSIVSSGVVFWLLFRLAQRETGRAYAGVVAAGLFAATYRIGGAWLDLARNDSLLLALTLGAYALVRWRESTTAWASAGLLLALAALTKQTAIMMSAPLLLYALVLDWRKGLALAATAATLVGMATLLLNRVTDGWFLFYVVHLPAAIQRNAPEWQPLSTIGLVEAVPVATVLAAATLVAARPWEDRRRTFWPLVALAGVGAAFSSRLHSGAYDNVWLPAYLSVSLLAGMASPLLCARVPDRICPGVRIVVAALCAYQLVSLRYSVAAQLPTAQDVRLARTLAQQLVNSGGEAFLPSHSFVPTPAGSVMHAHTWAIGDILRGGQPLVTSQLSDDIQKAFASGRFRVIVLDKVEPWMEPGLDQAYRVLGPALPADGLWTRTGYLTKPRFVYGPRSPIERTKSR